MEKEKFTRSRVVVVENSHPTHQDYEERIWHDDEDEGQGEDNEYYKRYQHQLKFIESIHIPNIYIYPQQVFRTKIVRHRTDTSTIFKSSDTIWPESTAPLKYEHFGTI